MLFLGNFFSIKEKVSHKKYDENLVLRLLSEDDDARNQALGEVSDITNAYQQDGLLAIEEAIKRKAGQPGCTFFNPEHTTLEPSKLEHSGPCLVVLAQEKKILDNIELSGNLISHLVLASHIPLFDHMGQEQVISEIQAIDKDQYIAFQLLHAQLHSSAKWKYMETHLNLEN